jgi:mono/diheme cytochrome c family protein
MGLFSFYIGLAFIVLQQASFSLAQGESARNGKETQKLDARGAALPEILIGVQLKKDQAGALEGGSSLGGSRAKVATQTEEPARWTRWGLDQVPENKRKKLITYTQDQTFFQRLTHSGDGRQASGAWTSINVSNLVDLWIEGMPTEQKAAFDLLVFEKEAEGGRSGHRALVPRWLVNKYPIRLAWARKGEPLQGNAGPWALVIPGSSLKAVAKEELPLHHYSGNGFGKVTLTNYRTQFPELFLKRRSDPVSMRGEKLFVQNCMSCHGAGLAPELHLQNGTFAGESAVKDSGKKSELGASEVDLKIKRIAEVGHPSVPGGPTWGFRDRKALVNYLESFRRENPIVARQAFR